MARNEVIAQEQKRMEDKRTEEEKNYIVKVLGQLEVALEWKSFYLVTKGGKSFTTK
jgi:hypothetical protein